MSLQSPGTRLRQVGPARGRALSSGPPRHPPGAFVASVTGNWNSAATWGGSGVPVAGDTCTINNGVTVTVPAGYTAVCGNSPADDTGTPALQCATAAGTGVLNVNGTFKYKGPVRQANATWTVGAGGTITYDATGAATPATALYTWQIAQAASQANAKLVFNGSSGSRCTVNSQGSVQSGGFGNVANNAGGGRIEASFTDFSYHGAATAAGNLVNSNLNSGAGLFFDDCTIDHCGQIQATGPFVSVAAGVASDATIRLRRTRITNPANTSFTTQWNFSSASLITTGVRLVEFCEIAGQVYVLASDGTLPAASGMTIQHNLFRMRDLSTGAMTDGVMLNGSGVATWTQNLLAMVTCSTGTVQDPKNNVGGGTLTNSYCYRQPCLGSNGANMHPIYLDQRFASIALTGWVFQLAHPDTQGDYVNMTREATAARTVGITNSLYLPNSTGLTAGSFLNQQGAVTQNQTAITFDHNTAACGAAVPSTTIVWGVGTEGGATWPAGAVASIRSNLLWNVASGAGTVANSATPSSTVNADAVTAANFNWTWNVTGSIYGNPVVQFAGTEGANDGTGDPQFVDASRSVLTFDQGYSSQAVATAWAASAAYAVGDLRSTAVAGFFSTATINWRCVAAHTSSASDKPGSGSSYSQYWEPAGLKTIGDSLIAGTTYSGGTNSLVGELVAWVKAGFRPQAAGTATAGHDGATVGAVAF